MSERIQNYGEFWPHYLREHAKPATRYWHYGGTTLALIAITGLIASANLWFLGLAAIGGYGPAWIAHYFVEKNRPASFTHPFWSLFSDFRMYVIWLAGRLEKELEQAGVRADGTIDPQAA